MKCPHLVTMRNLRSSAHLDPWNQEGTKVTGSNVGKVECCSNLGKLEFHPESTQSFHKTKISLLDN